MLWGHVRQTAGKLYILGARAQNLPLILQCVDKSLTSLEWTGNPYVALGVEQLVRSGWPFNSASQINWKENKETRDNYAQCI